MNAKKLRFGRGVGKREADDELFLHSFDTAEQKAGAISYSCAGLKFLILEQLHACIICKITTNEDELLVFGYASQIYANDERAEWIAEGRHLITHPADCQLLIDRWPAEFGMEQLIIGSIWIRHELLEWIGCNAAQIFGQDGGMLVSYDCRLHLLSAEALDLASVAPDQEAMKSGGAGNGYECPAELLEEEMCEEERYKDMQEDIARLEQEEENKQKRSEIAFSYDESNKAASSSSEEEIDEPFQPPENIKLPLGMNLPDTMKQNAVIERTAIFVVAQGPQMEIVIKAKQRGSQDQFGFLEFDHPLNAYYKYISKMIREKKYVPKPHIPSRRPKLKKLKRLEEEKRLAKENMTNKISSSNSDSDSDSTGNYLHPLLMGGARKIDSRSSSPVIGPKTREESDAVGKKQLQVKIDYKLGKADDMYSSLFKNLSDLVVAQIKSTHSAGTSNQDAENAKKEVEKGEYYEWYLTFYGEPPPCNEQPNVIPPPPDIMPSVNSAAEYVSRYGVQAEQLLLGRQDLNVGFLHPGEPYHGYYHSRIRHYQKLHSSYLQSQKILRSAEAESDDVFKQEVIDMGGNEMEQSIVVGDDFNHEQPTTLASSFSDLLQAPPPPPPFMNRKMRRRGFHDPPRTPDPAVPDTADIAEIGVVDFDIPFSKIQSSPALLDSAVEQESLSPPTRKVPSGPISFSLNIQKVDDKKVPKTASAAKLGAYEDEESGGTEMVDVPPGVLNNIPPPGLTIPPPPVAPVPLSSGQLAAEGSAELQSERKLKARLFMERILNEKRAAKLRAQNEEQQKRENELLKKYEETRGTSTSSPKTKSRNRDTMDDLDMSISASAIDQLINLRIDKVINETFKERGDRKHSKSHYKKEKRKRDRRRGENRHSDDDESVEKSSKHNRRRSCDKSDSPEQKVSSRRKKRKKRRHHRSSSSNGDAKR